MADSTEPGRHTHGGLCPLIKCAFAHWSTHQASTIGAALEGYAKPMMHDIEMTSSAEHENNALQKLWEGIVEFAARILENRETGEVAARIPFRGTIKNPQSSIFATIVSVLHNAFVGAFARSLEDSISIRDVKQNLGRIGDDESRHSDKKKDDKSEDQEQKPGSKSNKAPMQPET